LREVVSSVGAGFGATGLIDVQRKSGWTGSINDLFAIWNRNIGYYLRVNGGSANLIDDLTTTGASRCCAGGAG
jgi:hypothetical protein